MSTHEMREKGVSTMGIDRGRGRVERYCLPTWRAMVIHKIVRVATADGERRVTPWPHHRCKKPFRWRRSRDPRDRARIQRRDAPAPRHNITL